MLDYTPTVSGTYKVRVKATSGASDYTLQLSYGQTSSGTGLAAYSKTYGFADTQSPGVLEDLTDRHVGQDAHSDHYPKHDFVIERTGAAIDAASKSRRQI